MGSNATEGKGATDPAQVDLPGTVQRSSKKAQRTYAETLASAHEEYSSEERAHRTAIASLKHSFEKVGDHWEPKAEKGPSDERAKRGQRPGGDSAGGVDMQTHTKAELYQRAKRLGVHNRSKMSKLELAQAIERKQD